ncbi:MAG: GerMN domain-containing protein [Vicinamibacteria bacterium]|nr:GerMN domain-containing protein [Vicinamibacteria bacterium]
MPHPERYRSAEATVRYLSAFQPRRAFRLTTGRVNVLLVLGLVSLQMLVSLTAPRWARWLQRPIVRGASENGLTPEASPPAAAIAGSTPEARRAINVKLFFEATDRAGLALEERAVQYHSDLARQLRVVLEELIRGSQTGLGAAVDPQTRVLDVLVSARGVAYVDLSPEVIPAAAGSHAELLTVYSIVNTLSVNFPVVTRVQIIVGDRTVETLAGHVDLSRPLLPNMALLAAARSVTLEPPVKPDMKPTPLDQDDN